MNKKGFTLVELLVVVAIIGILSSVAVVNLNSARDKAKMSAVKTQLNSILPLINLCYSFDNSLLYDGNNTCDGSNSIVEDTVVCNSVTDKWPALENGYNYDSCESDIDDFSFSFGAIPPEDSSGLKEIVCNRESLGCQEAD